MILTYLDNKNQVNINFRNEGDGKNLQMLMNL